MGRNMYRGVGYINGLDSRALQDHILLQVMTVDY